MKRGGASQRNGRRHGKANNQHSSQNHSPHINTAPHPSHLLPSSPSVSPLPSASPLPSHSPSLSPSSSPLPPSSPAPSVHSASDLFIRNLHPTTTAHTLHSLFSPYGPIHSLRIIQTKTTPRYSREIAYLSYHLPQSAAAAVDSMHGAYVDGRFILVAPSRVMSDKRDWLFSGLEPALRREVQLDDVAEYSVTDSVTADSLSALLLAFIPAESTVTDACACVGGNTLSFARHFAHVQSCEYDRLRFDMLNHNLALLSASSTLSSSLQPPRVPSVSTILASYLDVMPIWRQDAVFIDPPFGADFELHSLVHPTLADRGMGQLVRQLFQQSRPTKAVLLKLPRNVDWRRIMQQLKGTGPTDGEEKGRVGGGGGVGRVNVAKIHFPKLIALLFERELSEADFEEQLRSAAVGGVRDGITRYVYDWTEDARLEKAESDEERKVDEFAPAHQQQHEQHDEADGHASQQQQQQQWDGRQLWRDVSDWSSVDDAIMQQLAAHDPHEPFTPFVFARDKTNRAKKAKKKLAKRSTRKDDALTLSVQNFFAAFSAAGDDEAVEEDEDNDDD